MGKVLILNKSLLLIKLINVSFLQVVIVLQNVLKIQLVKII